MKVSVQYQSLSDEVKLSLSQRAWMLQAARTAVRKVSFAAERRVKVAMPVDTGRARASWGHWTPGDLRSGATDASAADAEWTEDPDGLSITQGSNVEYVIYLNDGHSAQAPAGFIDKAEQDAQRELDQEIDEIMRAF